MIRTTERTVIFRHPFFISGFSEPLPAGDYRVETDEELLEGLSFQAYRRVLTVMQIPAEPKHPGMTHSLIVDSDELEATLKRDRELSAGPDGKDCLRESSTTAVESCREAAGRHALKRSAVRARNRTLSNGAAHGLQVTPAMKKSAG